MIAIVMVSSGISTQILLTKHNNNMKLPSIMVTEDVQLQGWLVVYLSLV